ncbi:hypothetical protein Hokovirus_4_49 [Hokovirus HKV1]|uniref:Uncharacterized protein n=1 Tax=Hokovirus HKV1 TaxID=1977638 RepID=A0A1V0SH80_9VIRU|nr:hypothetical protein Hokovirus_4_49 [Hokovirus HKV1]
MLNIKKSQIYIILYIILTLITSFYVNYITKLDNEKIFITKINDTCPNGFLYIKYKNYTNYDNKTSDEKKNNKLEFYKIINNYCVHKNYENKVSNIKFCLNYTSNEKKIADNYNTFYMYYLIFFCLAYYYNKIRIYRNLLYFFIPLLFLMTSFNIEEYYLYSLCYQYNILKISSLLISVCITFSYQIYYLARYII